MVDAVAAPLVLVAIQGALRLGRVVGERPRLPVRVQWRDDTGQPQVTKVERSAIALRLTAPAADLAEVDALRMGALAAVPAADIDTAWALLGAPEGPTELASLGALAALVVGADTPTLRDQVAIAVAQHDDAFWLEGGSLWRRGGADRARYQQDRAVSLQAARTAAPWLGVVEDLRAGRTPSPAARAALVTRLEACVLSPEPGDLAVDHVLRAARSQRTVPWRDAATLLVELGAWDAWDDVDLARSGLLAELAPAVHAAAATARPDLPPGGLPRLDLPFVSVDSANPHEVDDAVWIEPAGDGWRLWVAIASPACWTPVDGPVDLSALERGATLYHPRHVVGMLPDPLARGHASLVPGAPRPALVFRIDLDADGNVVATDVAEAEIAVQAAWSYDAVDAALLRTAPDLSDGPVDASVANRLCAAGLASERARVRNGAWLLYKPDVEVRAPRGKRVDIRAASQTSPGRRFVTEAMVLAGLAAARFCAARRAPVPFRVQGRPHDPPLPPGVYTTPADAYALFRTLAPARYALEPAPHGVLGVEAYVQASSPLRRYLDLLAHRQIIASLRGLPLPHSAAEVGVRVVRAEAGQQARRSAQRNGDRRFKLVWLAERGVGTRLQADVVRILPARGHRLAYVSALGLEVSVHDDTLRLGDAVTVRVHELNPATGHLVVRPV